MSCQELVELVTEYFEGELSWRQRRRFDKHISGCPWCQRYVEQMGLTIKIVGRLDAESISPHAREELMHAFSDWRAGA